MAVPFLYQIMCLRWMKGMIRLKKKVTVLFLCIYLLLLSGRPGLDAEAKETPGKYEQIDSYLQKQMDEQAIKGLAYAIVEKDKVVHLKAFGKADKDKSLTVQTPMKLASLSKSFTSLAIMQLAEEGKIKLDSPVKDYIPWFQLKDKKAASNITIRHLLNQTSGISSNGDIQLGNELLGKSLEDTVRLMEKVEPAHPAGTKFEYSNLNYLCLGLVVEYVSGQSLANYMQTHILLPLKMTHSYPSIADAKKHGLSEDFTSWFGMLLPTKTIMSDLPNFLASGYMASSAEDMGKYLMMFMNKGILAGQRLVSEEGIQTLHDPSETAKMYLDSEYFGDYAMGWWQRRVQGTTVIGHSGDLFAAARTDMYIIPEKQIGVVILTNTNTGTFAPGDSHISTDGVISMLAGKEPQIGETQSFTFYYVIFDAAVIMILAGLLFYGIRLRRKLAKFTIVSKWSLIIAVIQTILPFGMIVMGPLLAGAPSWGFLFCVQADLVIALLLILLTVLALGLTKIVWMVQSSKRLTPQLIKL